MNMDATANRPLLILDLDETLIYGSEKLLDRDADFVVGPFHVYKRPGLDAFLSTVNRFYDLAIWSSASGDYVSDIASTLQKSVSEWIFVWSRTRCVQRMHPETFETIPIKDLRKAVRRGYPLERILIVDDTREKVCRNYGNAIYVTEFIGSNTDEELPQLARYLIHLRSEPNFRRIEKRGWRNKQIPNIHE